MNSDLLDADCVILHLCKKDIIALDEWKRNHPNDQDYNVFFNRPGDKIGDVGLNIIKRSGRYYIARSLVNILSYRHNFNADNIYKECTVCA